MISISDNPVYKIRDANTKTKTRLIIRLEPVCAQPEDVRNTAIMTDSQPGDLKMNPALPRK